MEPERMAEQVSRFICISCDIIVLEWKTDEEKTEQPPVAQQIKQVLNNKVSRYIIALKFS